MDCSCGGQTRVVDSRLGRDGYLRRRRECLFCRKRFTTYEVKMETFEQLQKKIARGVTNRGLIEEIRNIVDQIKPNGLG